MRKHFYSARRGAETRRLRVGATRALDHLEGYPRLYTREQINGGWWIYKMNRKDRFAEPSAAYYRMIEDGYRDFGLDDWYLRAAAAEAA